MKHYKRQWRELSDEHKQKLSQSAAGKPKSAEHRAHISQGLRDYWTSVPHKPGNSAELQVMQMVTKIGEL